MFSEHEQTMFLIEDTSQKPESIHQAIFFVHVLVFVPFSVCLDRNLAIWSSWTLVNNFMSSVLMPKQLKAALLQPWNGARIVIKDVNIVHRGVR